MNWNQPLCFTPHYQTRVWGGRHLEHFFGRTLPDPHLPYGESWEICDRPEAPSVVAEGESAGVSLHELWTNHRVAVFGQAQSTHPSPTFPLLMKILDACDDLSIQVHPPAHVAAELKGEPKTEMWFITHAEPGAKLYAGLKAGVQREDFELALAQGTVAELMYSTEGKAGDCLFLPSGRVHAIGAGLVIFEIQQNSDTTYRVFDWNRTGLDGQPRALHVEESLHSIDFTDHQPALQTPTDNGTLVNCEYFEVRHVPQPTHAGSAGEHLTLALTQGSLRIGDRLLKAGDFALIPAAMDDHARFTQKVSSDAAWLEVRLPPITC